MSHTDYIKKANKLLCRAYVPYSKFPVSAIVIDQDGNEYEGVNVENAAYGLCLCAERNAITSGVTKNLKSIRTIYITGNTNEPISPCGSCRQVIAEFSTKDTKIILGSSKTDEYKEMDLDNLIPYYFSKNSLDEIK
ncbi:MULTISPECIES: cytidine deaminase [Sneathia]|uniref:cytidine deaminase n=1 Tax=Sneathia TaxID=168808 RepID=UPI00186866D0|nr:MULTISPECIES: cytidine deaminase [Sneathia]MBE3031066.1 cytidine deaminase [Sneathia sp. DSM 16631]MDK9581649.1 cytidine deaminase [Sneathia vaginalis]